MNVNTLDRISSYSYRVDTEKMKLHSQQTDKNYAAGQKGGDTAAISEEGRNALKEKMSVVKRAGQIRESGKLSSVDSYGIMNDFEKIMSELGNGSNPDGFVEKTDSFDSYVNKMAAAYQLMKERIEEKYAASGNPAEYYVSDDGSMQELTKEKEMEMLDEAYEMHSRFMATNMQIWSELQDFTAQINYHSGGAKTETATAEKQNTDIKEQAYNAFMAAISEKNSELPKQGKDGLNHFRLDLGIPSSARDFLNSIWAYHAGLKRLD